MSLDNIVNWAVGLYHSYTVFAILFVVVLVIVTIIKPKPMFKFYIFVFFMAAVFYVLSYVADSVFTGAESKKHLSSKSRKAIE